MGGRGGGGSDDPTFFLDKFDTFPMYNFNAEISAKRTLLRIDIYRDPPFSKVYLRPWNIPGCNSVTFFAINVPIL